MLYINICIAQRGDKANRASLLSNELSISTDKAIRIINALDLNYEKIQLALKDKTLKIADRQQEISRLMIEQRLVIKSLLNEKQQIKLKDLFRKSQEKTKNSYESILAEHKLKYNKPLKGATLEKSEVKN